MAKRKSKKKPTRKKAKPLIRSSLVARSSPLSTAADVDITFTSGLGQATASLFRQGILINMQSISMSDIIHFSEVQSGDVIVINGVCTGNVIIRAL